MNNIMYIVFGEHGTYLNKMIEASFLDGDNIINIGDISDIKNIYGLLRHKKIIFVMELNSIGINSMALDFLSYIKDSEIKDLFEGTTCGLFIKSPSELYTKSFGRKFIMECNMMGAAFIGHPLIEATGSMNNFLTWQKTIDKSTSEICLDMCKKQGVRLRRFTLKKFERPKILVLHASSHKTSNTIGLWKMVREKLDLYIDTEKSCDITELHVEDGTVLDCKGCDFVTCMHYASTKSCFYGGPMVKEILPNVESSDIIIILAPNYNDSISAKLMAVVNRLTVLYRVMSFYDKKVYSLVVSGNSGSDCVILQIIDAMNMNKGFYLPPYFSITETANDPGSILSIPNIDKKAEDFAYKFHRENCYK